MAFNNCFGNGGIGAGACGSGSLMLGPKPLYEEIAVIGNGAYGTVYKGCELKTSRIVAMKRIRIQITQEGLPISTIREIAYLRQLDKYEHENVVKLLDVVTGPRLPAEQSIILIFEYVDYDLHTYMKSQSGPLGTAKIVDLMGQMLTGVDFLHANRIIHVRSHKTLLLFGICIFIAISCPVSNQKERPKAAEYSCYQGRSRQGRRLRLGAHLRLHRRTHISRSYTLVPFTRSNYIDSFFYLAFFFLLWCKSVTLVCQHGATRFSCTAHTRPR